LRIAFNQTNWNNWMLTKMLSARTRYEYNNYLRKILWPNGELEISQDEVLAHIARQPYNSVCRAFMNNLIFYIKTNHNYPLEIREAVGNIYIPKSTGRKKRVVTDFLNEKEILAMVNFTPDNKLKLMILLTFYCGLRESELVGDYAITPMNFSWQRWLTIPEEMGTLRVKGKGNKIDRVLVPAFLMQRIHRFIKTDLVMKQSREDKLFNIGPRRWAQILSKLAKASIMRHFNPHLLRHSYGTWLKANGYHIDEIKIMMRHVDIKSTIIYERIDDELLKSKYPQTIVSEQTDSMLD
jgi:site-specific recombinase XerD